MTGNKQVDKELDKKGRNIENKKEEREGEGRGNKNKF